MNFRIRNRRTLYICHSTREDLILGFLGEYQRIKQESSNDDNAFEAALIVCGRKGVYQLSREVEDMIVSHVEAPVLHVGLSSHDVVSRIHGFTPKLNLEDRNRVDVAVDHYEGYLDFETLLERTQSSSYHEEPTTTSR